MVSFNKATENDIEKIRELAKISWHSTYINIISQEQINYMLGKMYSVEEISSHLENPNYHYFLIHFNENIVGFMGFENHFEENTTKLHRLYLLPESKGKGIGKSVLNFLKDSILKTTDCRIILNVNKENPAKNVYLSQGFTIYKEIVLNIGNGFVMDDYILEFKL